MSPPNRWGRAACHRRPTTKTSCREEAEAPTLRVVEAPVGSEYADLIAALLHLEAACGFPAGIPSQRQTEALRSTRRYRALVAHLPQWPEESP
ncbi:hypothetical protein GCM10023320_57040 [Pseudonocardia adelaidensis]|uniref:Uncharacterized protein n=1 Tax=Pseudonocardia adelaidensis TaxID=648754 RepID=A0ABP9NST9_9PSEU